jgi:hypothetical protein
MWIVSDGMRLRVGVVKLRCKPAAGGRAAVTGEEAPV